MKTDREYITAIEQANKNIEDIKKRGSDAIGTNALNFMYSLFLLYNHRNNRNKFL